MNIRVRDPNHVKSLCFMLVLFLFFRLFLFLSPVTTIIHYIPLPTKMAEGILIEAVNL